MGPFLAELITIAYLGANCPKAKPVKGIVPPLFQGAQSVLQVAVPMVIQFLLAHRRH
jgi:hypothetical protein